MSSNTINSNTADKDPDWNARLRFTLKQIAHNSTTAKEQQSCLFDFSSRIANLTQHNNNLDKETPQPFTELSQYTLHVLSENFIRNIPASKKKFAPKTISAARKLLSSFDYDEMTEYYCQDQADLIGVIACLTWKDHWGELPRSERIAHLNKVASVTDYLMTKKHGVRERSTYEEKIVFDEGDLDESLWHRPKFINPGAYYSSDDDTITMAYYKDHDTIENQNTAYIYLAHEMSHRLSYWLNLIAPPVTVTESQFNDSHIRSISSHILSFFEENMNRISKKEKIQAQKVSSIYRSSAEERVAYSCNSVVKESIEYSSLGNMDELHELMKEAPDIFSWLLDDIAIMQNKWEIVGDPDFDYDMKLRTIGFLHHFGEMTDSLNDAPKGEQEFMKHCACKLLKIDI